MYVLRRTAAPPPPHFDVLVLRRARGRSPGSWETVHGTIEPGESPVEAARREVREETGLAPLRLYNVSRVEAFYRHTADEIALVPVFAALVDPAAAPRPGPEHDRIEWLAPDAAAARFAWPRERRAIADVVSLFAQGGGIGGGGGPGEGGEMGGLLDDVLRIS